MDEDRQEVWDALTTRASQLFGKDASEFTEDTKFEDLGIKSVQVSQITTYIEDELDIEVPYMKFRRCATFGEAADFVCEPLDE
jgi:acyl carrier protein